MAMMSKVLPLFYLLLLMVSLLLSGVEGKGSVGQHTMIRDLQSDRMDNASVARLGSKQEWFEGVPRTDSSGPAVARSILTKLELIMNLLVKSADGDEKPRKELRQAAAVARKAWDEVTNLAAHGALHGGGGGACLSRWHGIVMPRWIH